VNVSGQSTIRPAALHLRAAAPRKPTLATVALGLQAAALTGIGGVTVRTTYVSGQLTRLAQESVRRLGGGGDRDVRLGLIAGIWLCYVAGATLGSFGLDELSTWALAIPVTALLAASCAS
jgi:uncharacterized membrane protein YoaK (UPF0700 family)